MASPYFAIEFDAKKTGKLRGTAASDRIHTRARLDVGITDGRNPLIGSTGSGASGEKPAT
jgi:hypothetical protein